MSGKLTHRQLLLKSASGPPPGGDPYFANVVSLLNFDDPDGLVFTDVKGNAWTPHGSVAMVGGEAVFSGGWLTSAALAALGIGLQPYTVEIICAMNTTGGNQCVFDSRKSTEQGVALYSQISSLGNYAGAADNAAIQVADPAVPGAGTYFYMAVARYPDMRMFMTINGGPNPGTVSDSRDYAHVPSYSIGDNYVAPSQPFFGRIKALRVTVGVVRYPIGILAFTPPTYPFPEF